MKKALLVALLCSFATVQAHAQYIKQIINFSLTGYKGPEIPSAIGSVVHYTPQAFSVTDRALCQIIAAHNGISVHFPQLIRLMDINGNFIGYYVTDRGIVVADASDYIGRTAQDYLVNTATDSFGPRTGVHSVSLLVHGFDTWGIGLINLYGMDTRVIRFTYTDPDLPSTYTFDNFVVPVSGGYTNSTTGGYACCTGTIRGSSAVVNTIPGL
jgi:hypothetical protein